MYSYHPEPLTQPSARSIVHDWLTHNTEKPRQAYSWSQKNWLMGQLAEQCIAESLRLGEDKDRLCGRLNKAHDIISSTRYSAMWESDSLFRTQKKDEKSPKELEQIESAKHIIWERHNPETAYYEGMRSKHYIRYDKSSLLSTIADYLDRPYLRHPMLDWVFVDMLVSRELILFGEEIKMRDVPGKHDTVGNHARYFKAEGNLAEMNKFNWIELLQRWCIWFCAAFAFPIAAIWESFYWHYTALGLLLAGIYAFAAVVFVKSRVDGEAGPYARNISVWYQMCEVWRLLEGPVVHPTIVREAMIKTREKGAVWDNACWSLIDRVIAINPAVWVVQPDRG